MSKFIGWIRTHTWETVSIVLGVALVVVIGLLVGSAGGSPDDGSGPSTTTLAGVTTTTDAGGAPQTTVSGGGGSTTTTEAEPITEGVTAVVVDNMPGVGLQIGLNAADLIIETPVEGGLTRFTALYGTDVPSLIGPVRSLRPVSADLLAPFSPVVFTTGGQPFVVGAVSNSGVTVVTPDDSIGFQSLERPRPHHIFVTPGEDVPSGVEIVPPWEVGEWGGGEPATSVELSTPSGVSWRYEDGSYIRYVGDELQQVLSEFDGDPEPMTRDTLILLVANQKSAGYTDGAGADVPTFDVIGGGDLYVLHAGEVIEGSWSRLNQGAGYRFIAMDGSLLEIPSGAAQLVVVSDTSDGVRIGR